MYSEKPPENPRTSQHYGIEVFKRGSKLVTYYTERHKKTLKKKLE